MRGGERQGAARQCGELMSQQPDLHTSLPGLRLVSPRCAFGFARGTKTGEMQIGR